MFATPPAPLKLDEPVLVNTNHRTAAVIATPGRMLATPRDTPIEEVRSRYKRDGYVWMKRLIDPEIVDAARADYFRSMKDVGILDPAAPVEDGILAEGKDGSTLCAPGSVASGTGDFDEGATKAFLHASIEAQQSEWFKKFTSTPQLLNFVKELTQWDDPLILKRQMLRASLPEGDGVPTHYDQLFFRHGPPTHLTAWTPFDDTLPERGGLMYLSDSAALGEQLEAEFSEMNKFLTPEERKSAFNANMLKGGILHPDAGTFAAGVGRKWLLADYETGDVVFHNAFIIHASCVNKDAKRRIMVHTDTRFVNPAEPFDTRWLNYWKPQDGL